MDELSVPNVRSYCGGWNDKMVVGHKYGLPVGLGLVSYGLRMAVVPAAVVMLV